jgi:hypothetical protein
MHFTAAAESQNYAASKKPANSSHSQKEKYSPRNTQKTRKKQKQNIFCGTYVRRNRRPA